jgi:hypothetical protein
LFVAVDEHEVEVEVHQAEVSDDVVEAWRTAARFQLGDRSDRRARERSEVFSRQAGATSGFTTRSLPIPSC